MTPYLQQRALLFQPLPRKPSSQLGLVIVIPACRDQQLLLCLMALHRCTLPDSDVDIIVVIHDSEADAPEARALNLSIGADAERWAARHNSTRRWFHIVYHCGMSRRDAGPELARKIGLDEACRRLEQVGSSKGVIACLDSGSRCAVNYLSELELHFRSNYQCPASSIYFEYPLKGAEHPYETYIAAANHELSLRYLVQAQRYAGYPYSFHTQGPGMAVRCDAYQQYGGMNARRANKDLPLLNSFTALPHFLELTSTCIHASPQLSDRLSAQHKILIHNKLYRPEQLKTYSFQIFEDLRLLFQNIPLLYHNNFDDLSLPESLRGFAQEIGAASKIAELRRNAADADTFQLDFFNWFNQLMINKFARFAKDHYYPDVPLTTACKVLLAALGEDAENDTFTMLRLFRQRDQTT